MRRALWTLALLLVACSSGANGPAEISTTADAGPTDPEDAGTGGGTTATCSTLPHATVEPIDGGPCAFVGCDPGWGNCDGDAANGCEADLSASPNCGACGFDCKGGLCEVADAGPAAYQCEPIVDCSVTSPMPCKGLDSPCSCGMSAGLCASTGSALFCCTGCVDNQGVCQPGTSDNACGHGLACGVCQHFCDPKGVCQ